MASPTTTPPNLKNIFIITLNPYHTDLPASRIHLQFPIELAIGNSMARVTVEDCLEQLNNRFALVILAAERTKQLLKGAEPLVPTANKPAVTALREIAAGKVYFLKNSKPEA